MRRPTRIAKDLSGLESDDAKDDLFSNLGVSPLVTRAELHQLVWSEPMTKIATRFGVSSSYMAKVCDLMNVPPPGRGFWAKLQAGKPVPRIPLPDARPSDLQQWSKGDALVCQSPPTPSPPKPRRARNKVSKTISERHQLVRGVVPLFEKVRSSQEDGYLRPTKKLLVDITSSRECLEKALDFANELFNAFEVSGHQVTLAPSHQRYSRTDVDEHEHSRSTNRQRYPELWSPWRPTLVFIDEVAFGLAIVEMSENIEMRYVQGKYVPEREFSETGKPRPRGYSWTTHQDIPSGRLRLVVYSPYYRVPWQGTWQETERTSLSSKIKSIVKRVAREAPNIVQKLEEANHKAEIERQEWLAAEERRRRAEDLRKTQQSFLDSREHLEQIITEWSRSLSISEFLAGLDNKVASLPETERQAIQARIDLARDILGNDDPMNYFLSWKTPDEIYPPQFPDEADQTP